MSDFWGRVAFVQSRLPELTREFCHIRTKGEGIQRIEPNAQQLHYQTIRAKREIVLKHRQGGHSTWKELEAALLFCLVPGFSGAIVSHEREATKRLMSIVDFALQMIPREDRPTLRHDTEEYLVSPAPPKGMGSRLYIGTAGQPRFGRGDTYHWCHLSELAMWPDPETVMIALSQTVPKEGYISIESTPMGRGNLFHNWYRKAKDGQIEYKAIFLPWWWTAHQYKSDTRGTLYPTDEELDLLQTAKVQGFELTAENLQWRRDKIAELGIYFQQEYPENDEDCFLVSGATIFDPNLVQSLIRRAESRPTAEEHEILGAGTLKVWDGYGVGHNYVIGADTAKGREKGDLSAAVVLDCKTGQHVASLYGRWPEHLFADELRKLGQRYGDAYIAVERNNPSVLVILKDVLHYEHLWKSRRYYDHDIADEPGWVTTQKSKRVLCAEFARALEAGDFRTWDAELLGQAFDALVNDEGRVYTRAGGRDDLLMAGMIANIAADDVANLQGGYGVKSYAEYL